MGRAARALSEHPETAVEILRFEMGSRGPSRAAIPVRRMDSGGNTGGQNTHTGGLTQHEPGWGASVSARSVQKWDTLANTKAVAFY